MFFYVFLVVDVKQGNAKIFKLFVGLNVKIPCAALIALVIESAMIHMIQAVDVSRQAIWYLQDLMLVNMPTYIHVFELII